MGGVVDYGVGLGTRTSPRHAAIEKAQTELRQEYDVREERKRELEFLEKGGNPLDFKFGHATSISRQSTSLPGLKAEQYVISEAKGSFTLSASPHGDSIESSGRLGGSLGRDTNIADNLLLFDGESSNPIGEKNLKRTGKRGNASLLEQSSEGNGRIHSKGTEDSLIFHLGAKNQAYIRRNRSRSSRDAHSNKAVVLSSILDHRDGNRLMREARAENRGTSNVSNSKAGSPNGNLVSEVSASDCKLDMEIDEADTCHTNTDKIKGGLNKGEAEANISETAQNMNPSNERAIPSAKQLIKDEVTSVDPHSVSLDNSNMKIIRNFERLDGSGIPDKDETDAFHDNLSRNNRDADITTEALRLRDLDADTFNADKESRAADSANSEYCDMVRNLEGGSNGGCPERLILHRNSDNKGVIEDDRPNDVGALSNATNGPIPSNLSNSIVRIKDEEDISDYRIDMSTEIMPLADSENLKTNGDIISKYVGQPNNSLTDGSHSINKGVVIRSSLLLPPSEPLATQSRRDTPTASAVQNSEANQSKLAKKAQEDAILKEARIIEANLKRASQASTSYKSSEKRQKCHWDFVLEEMAWMANDFMQERLWKTAAAAHVCHRIASSGRLKFEQETIYRNQKDIARTLSKAVMHFWHSADVFRTTGEAPNDQNEENDMDLSKSCRTSGEAEKDQRIKYTDAGNNGRHLAIKGYAVRFLKYDCSVSAHSILAEAPSTPDRVKDAGILETSSESEHSEEDLFYTVPPGAMQIYRETVESQWLNYQKMVSPVNQEDCEASLCNSLSEGPWKNEYEEEEGETGSYFLPGAFEGNILPKFAQKKKKNLPQKYTAWSYNNGSDFSYEAFPDGKSANRPLIFMGKRPSSTANVGPIPTKRIRTAGRQQRVVSPFAGGATGSLQITNKTDASSGDTSSIQDDQSSMHGGSQSWKNMDVESTADFDKQLTFDGSETCPKFKKKKSKHSGYSMNPSDSGVLVASGKGSMFDQSLQADSMVQQEQAKRRFESQHYESNGYIGTYGHHAAKKLKLLKQPTEPSKEAIVPASGSISSPVASQMSNMSNQHKFIKIITNRDRGRKGKAMKMAAGQSGSGNSWTTFEDQALVVLVHDMGPNWELVSDAINNTLQFKCIFRKPLECKERHKILMEKSAGDGADSAEDSGSSQPYPSTLPGIPKGSARQLFQRLQGPMEEDTLKTHFEKIILIGQKLHSHRTQKDTQELKQIAPVHSSHFIALSQTCPNNLGGGVLSPLDLCDAISSTPEILNGGYQGSYSSSTAVPNHHGSLSPVCTSGPTPILPASSGIVLGSNLSSPSTPLNASSRDGQRHAMPRTASLPVDDQQKMHYAQMLLNRTFQPASVPAPGSLPVGVDRGAHMLPGGNGMGLMSSRTPMPRPGFPGMISPGMPMVSTGGMIAGGSSGVPCPASVHPAAVSGPVNSMPRPRDASQVPRPGQNTEDHRQMIMQDIQPQISQGNCHTGPPLNAMSAPFSMTGLPPAVQSYPSQQNQQMQQQPHILGNHHRPHIQGVNHSSPQQQAYAIRLAKERQLQQRMMPQSQQPYSSSSPMPTVHNSAQIQQQTHPSSSATSSSQAQHSIQQMPPNPQASSGMPNQVMKPRQRLQPRPQQQQKQLLQPQAKLAKGIGGGAMMMHQNQTVDTSQVSGMPAASRNQVPLMQQPQGFFSGSPGLPQSSSHHKLYPRPPSQLPKQMPSLPPAHSDTSNQRPSPVPQLPTSIPLAAPSPPKQQQRQMNQNMQRIILQQNRQLSSDGRVQSSGDQTNQVTPATSLTRCTDSSDSAPVVSSTVQWKAEPSYETSSPALAAHSAGSPSGNQVGNDTLVRSSSEGSEKKQISRNVSNSGHGIGGKWQAQQQQPQQQQQQPQHPHRQGVQGNLYGRPSQSGSG